jgi:AraC family transcriptional regulator of adaptative response / DNA-3-methyladenine glycosylase II
VPGVEEWRDGTYRRVLRLDHGPAIVALSPAPSWVSCVLRLADLRDLASAVARCRRLLDLDADPEAVDASLGEDPALGALIAPAPGRRVPRTVDPAELAVRVVLGQQISTVGARTLTARVVALAGPAVVDPDGGLTHGFPWPSELLALADDVLPLPARRRDTVRRLAAALDEGRLEIDVGADWERANASLAAIPGIGPWTEATIAMRALGDPDAFPAGDLGVTTAAGRLGLPGGSALVAHSQRWRPWRAYATQYLWGATDHRINRFPTTEEDLTCRAS